MVNYNPIDYDYIVSYQSDLENTKESILPVSDKPYHKIKENMPLVEELENLWNYPLDRMWKKADRSESLVCSCNEHESKYSMRFQ